MVKLVTDLILYMKAVMIKSAQVYLVLNYSSIHNSTLYFQYYFLILHDFSLLLQLRRLFVLLAVHVIVMEGSKSITMENGELSVMTTGISLMQMLSAKVWAFLTPQLIDGGPILEKDLERYG